MTPLEEHWIVWTARVAVAFYVAALLTGFDSGRGGSAAGGTGQGKLSSATKWLWTAAGLTFVLHVGLAFQFLHHWSHASAYRHTAERTEQALGQAVGAGIWVNYLFLLWWTVDIALLWSRPEWRTPRYRLALQSFLAFILFNATAVFGPPWWRWAIGPVLLLLGIAWLLRRRLRARAEEDRVEAIP